MAVLSVNPLRCNVTAITAQQASNDGSAFVFNDDFAAWVTNNMPMCFYVLGGNFFVSIDDYYGSVISDYMANWM